VLVRAVPLRVQSLSGSRSPPPPRMAGAPQPCGSATLAQVLAGTLCTSVLAVTGITSIDENSCGTER
jgi:hypothetical protein